MSTSSDTFSRGNPDSYGEHSGRSELEVGFRQLGFSLTPEGQRQDAQELPLDSVRVTPIPTVGANEAPKSKALADVTSDFNRSLMSSPKKRTTVASQDDVQVRTTAPLASFASAP